VNLYPFVVWLCEYNQLEDAKKKKKPQIVNIYIFMMYSAWRRKHVIPTCCSVHWIIR
jgi:hypothetical protein